jgi:hypothetical protein
MSDEMEGRKKGERREREEREGRGRERQGGP